MGRVSKGVGKTLKRRLSVPVYGLLGAGMAASYIGTNGDSERAGENMSNALTPVVSVAGDVVVESYHYAEGVASGFDLPNIDMGIESSTDSDSVSVSGSAVLNLSGATCNSGTYSLETGVWGALEEARYSSSISDAIAQNPGVVSAAQNGAQTVDITCG
ncbi:hypothetical protein KBB49_01410 [Candidatus Saccharibacteria bacterium]|jgi:hypothetical protein|nr:hypothetical protein [Candidatus Saccharibacteria bacterium]